MTHHQEAVRLKQELKEDTEPCSSWNCKQEPDSEDERNTEHETVESAVKVKEENNCKTDDSDIYTGAVSADGHVADILDTSLGQGLTQPGLSVGIEGILPQDQTLGVMRMVYQEDDMSVVVMTDDSFTESASAEDSVVCRLSKTDMSDTQNNGVMTVSNETEAGEEISHSETRREMSGTDTATDPQKLQGDRNYLTRDGDCDLPPASSDQIKTHRQVPVRGMNVAHGGGFTKGVSNRKRKKLHKREQACKCDVCGVSFTARSSLVQHERIHTGEKPYKCEVCGVCFTVGSSLTRHKRVHTGERPYQCDVCNLCFTTSSYLKIHKKIHTGEKLYKCDVCSVCFTDGSSLIRHKGTHRGEKPYKCDVCSAGFSNGSNLRQHSITHTGEKPYKCDVCDVCFTVRSNLTRHKRKHSGEKPFQCQVCHVCFTDLSSLKHHKITHTGEKPYKCDVCGACFAIKRTFIHHSRVHTGEKPYKCDICGACFTVVSNLLRHKKIHIKRKTTTQAETVQICAELFADFPK